MKAFECGFIKGWSPDISSLLKSVFVLKIKEIETVSSPTSSKSVHI